jgi:hypothetical protein
VVASPGNERREERDGEDSARLAPYASNWSGTLGRGDLVIPQREIPRVIHEILDAVHELTDVHREAPEGEIFQALMESRRLPSVQDQLSALRKRFLIVSR